jgi:hypothetical protein
MTRVRKSMERSARPFSIVLSLLYHQNITIILNSLVALYHSCTHTLFPNHIIHTDTFQYKYTLSTLAHHLIIRKMMQRPSTSVHISRLKGYHSGHQSRRSFSCEKLPLNNYQMYVRTRRNRIHLWHVTKCSVIISVLLLLLTQTLLAS